MKRALVLGGGGNVGVAWEIGVLAGLLDGGIDARDVDLVIGTSAGSVIGANIAHGRDPRELLRAMREDPPPALGDRPNPDMSVAADAFGLWAGFDEMTQERRAQVGAIALRANSMPEDQWVASFDNNAWDGWPSTRLLVTAVDCESGAFRAFDAASGVGLGRACAASCSVPGLFPSVTIEGRKYTDGGVRSGTSADLALDTNPDVVLIVAPLGSGDRGIHVLCRKQLADERAALEAAGARVHAFHMDESAMAAGGRNLMDASLRLPTAAAGEAYGRRIADEIAGSWG